MTKYIIHNNSTKRINVCFEFIQHIINVYDLDKDDKIDSNYFDLSANIIKHPLATTFVISDN